MAANVSQTGALTNITFPVAFDTIPAVMITEVGNNLNMSKVTINTVTKNGFSTYGYYQHSTATTPIRWLAVS